MSVARPSCGIWFFPNRPTPELVAAIEQAEQAGLDEVWIGDEGPAREPFTVLAAAARTTTTIRLGVGITNPYVRHPALAVASAATIAELAPGRVVLGVGAGGAMSLDPFELSADRPVDAVRRFIEIARASAAGRATSGYRPSDIAVAAAVDPPPVFVGARGPRLNTLASEVADGVFVAGMAPFRFSEVVGWARSVRPIDVAIYPSAALDDAGREQHRPEMIWSLLDAPSHTLEQLGLDAADVRHAADAVRRGDPEPARRLVVDEVLEQLMILGTPHEVGAQLADLVVEHRPTSIGMAIVSDDLIGSIERAGTAFRHMNEQLENMNGSDDTWSA